MLIVSVQSKLQLNPGDPGVLKKETAKDSNSNAEYT